MVMETKAQSSQWKLLHEPRPKDRVRSNVKVLLTVFFDCIISSFHRVEPSISNITCKLCANCAKQSARFVEEQKLAFAAHTSLLVREFLDKNNTWVMPQQYSPDLAPSDFFLFQKLKSWRPTKGRRYATIEEIKTASKEELNKVQKMIFWSALRIGKNVGTSV